MPGSATAAIAAAARLRVEERRVARRYRRRSEGLVEGGRLRKRSIAAAVAVEGALMWRSLGGLILRRSHRMTASRATSHYVRRSMR